MGIWLKVECAPKGYDLEIFDCTVMHSRRSTGTAGPVRRYSKELSIGT